MSAVETALLDDALELERYTRWNTGRDGRRVAESSLRIGGMHCAACSGTIEAALRQVDGVVDARVSAAAQCATVRWQDGRTRPSVLVAAIERAGYSAVPDTAAGARALRRREARDALWRLFVAAFCSMQVMMLATPSYLAAGGELAPDLKQLLDWGSWVLTLPVLCFAATPFFAGAWRALRARRIGMDVPVALGIAVAFIASTGAAFDPGGLFGDEVWFDSLTMFVSFLLGGRYLEMRARHRAAQALEATLGEMPQAVQRVAPDGTVEAVSAQRLRRGDVLRVPLGQLFVADGVLLEGKTTSDESLLTGEAQPVAKRPGDALVAGSVNRGAPVVMRIERVGADTRHEQILALMREAQTQRARTLQRSERWAAPFLWTVLLLAAAAAAAWSVIDPSRAVRVAVAVLIVTCPCALSLAAPSALLAAAGAMARRGVLLRRLDAIEGLARLQTLFIDKTGTLTGTQQADMRIERLDADAPADDALRATAATLAAWSSHPLAAALARPAGTSLATGWHAVGETPGFGLQASDADGHAWRLGSAAWVGAPGNAAHDVADRDVADHGVADHGDADHGDAAVWLGRNGRPLAAFHIGEALRDDARSSVEGLAADGVRVVLLSGDTPRRVGRIARHAGIAEHHAGLRPEDKLEQLRAAQQRGEVSGMLGDGINDAPVLAQADVSLAMGEGAWVARAEADGVVVSNGLRDVLSARRLARRTMQVVRQNLLWAAVYNGVCVPLALVGWMPPWAAGLGMAASSLLVVANSGRLAR